MTQRPTITGARFTLNLEQVEGGTIRALNQPYQTAIQKYKRDLQAALPDSERDRVYIPSRRLNRTLLTVLPILGTGFEWMGDLRALRTLMVTPPGRVEPSLPAEQIATVMRVWASHWVEQVATDVRFQRKDGDGRVRREAAAALRTELEKAPDTDWEQLDVEGLIENLVATSYKAIPLLAATMLHGQTNEIERHPVSWRRVIGDGIQVSAQSQPLRSSGKAEEGYFSYVLSIELQTQAGRADPLIHLRPSIRRYADAAVTQANYDRNVGIIVGAKRARLDNYPIDDSLLYLTADLEDHKAPSSAVWEDEIAEVLGRLGARRLKEAGQVLADAPRDMHMASGEDEYFVVHAEGMEYDNEGEGDELESGMQFYEAAQVISSALALMPSLTPEPAFERDDPFNQSMLPARRPGAARTVGDLRVPHSQDPVVQEERAEDRDQSREQMIEAIQRATAGQSTYVTIITSEDAAKESLDQALRQMLYLEQHEPMPRSLCVSFVSLGPSDQHLLNPLDRGNTHWTADYHAFEQQMAHQFQEKMESWRAFLETHVQRHQGAWNLALIQLPPYKVRGQHPSQGIKGAVREACDRLGFLSQMVVRPTMKTHRWRQRREPSHNAIQAVADLLFRQTGALFDVPSRLFESAGLSSDLASKLQVLAIHLTSIQQAVKQYPTAVFLKPDGRFEVVAPGLASRESLDVAGPEIGKAFGRERIGILGTRRNPDSFLHMDAAARIKFLQELLLNLSEPTLVLINAINWRNHDVWPQLQNGKLADNPDILDFSNSTMKTGMIVQRQDPRVANLLGIIRLRSGDEMPYYVTSAKSWDRMIPNRAGRELRDLTQLTGFTDRKASMHHYFSLGALSLTSQEQNKGDVVFSTMLSGDAGRLAVRHAQLVEMVPFFMHQNVASSWRPLCRVAHMLRFSPAWEHANITNPLVMHLARKLVEDRLCILGGN